MRIIISPAKKMRVDCDSLPPQALPAFLQETERLLFRLRELNREELKRLWKCSDALVDLNRQRLAEMDLRTLLTPAIFSYEGIQYQHMAPAVFTEEELSYVQEHLRILSGFYGILRPFDGVTPYRLEMQAKLKADGCKDLYAFWGDQLARQLSRETDCILDLASKEYSQAVKPHLPGGVRWIGCTFGSRKEGKIVEKGTLCKMARGEMVRFLASEQAETIERAKAFQALGFYYAAEESTEERLVFLKEESKC